MINPLELFRESINGENSIKESEEKLKKCLEYFSGHPNDSKMTKDDFLYDCLKRACHSGEDEIAILLLNYGVPSDNKAFGTDHPVNRAILAGKEDLTLLLVRKSGFVRTS
jgi:hypothetical protein